jgi:Protein of unknown function (DUF3619)
MNTLEHSYRAASHDAVEARFARRVVARLNERADHVAPDVAERLRFARQRALEAAQRARATDAVEGVGSTGQGAAIVGFGRSRWWLRIASALPLLALVAGLLLIQESQYRSQISVAAEVDAALLGDDLPLTAYRDAGFVEYLKAPPGDE